MQNLILLGDGEAFGNAILYADSHAQSEAAEISAHGRRG